LPCDESSGLQHPAFYPDSDFSSFAYNISAFEGKGMRARTFMVWVVLFSFFLLATQKVKAYTTIASCPITIGNGEFRLDSDLINQPSCIDANANSIIDCQGHILGGNGHSNSYGIFIYGSNVTIKNCILSNWGGYYGSPYPYGAIRVWFQVNVSLYNNTIYNNNVGIMSCGANYEYIDSDIYNNRIYNNNYAIYVWGLGKIHDNQIYNNGEAIHLKYDTGLYGCRGGHNTIWRNRIYNNSLALFEEDFGLGHQWIYDNFFNNSVNIAYNPMEPPHSPVFFNTTMTSGTNIVNGHYICGNYWGTPTRTGFSDTCNDMIVYGICDNSTEILWFTDYCPYSARFLIIPSPVPSCKVCEPSSFSSFGVVGYMWTGVCLIMNLLICQPLLLALVVAFMFILSIFIMIRGV
jgi:hypothetical protein